MDNTLLKKWIENNNMDKAVEAIENLSSEEISERADFLISQLRETESKLLRNAIAISLADIQYNKAVKTLIELIKDKKAKGSRGTLLYALESLDYAEYVEELLPFLTDKSFEVSRQTYILLKAYLNTINQESKKKTIENMEELIEDLEEEIKFKEHIITLLK